MKRLVFKVASLFLGLAFLAACDPELKEKPVFPDFDQKTVTVEQGQELTLEFEANLDWTLSLPAELLQWFWFDDAGIPSDRLTGKKGPVSVKLCVSPDDDFEGDRDCPVTLTMKDESKVIVTYLRPGKERTLAIYPARHDEYGWVYAESGDLIYEYAEEPATSLSLVWPSEQVGYSLPIKVEANFEWTLALPEWIEARVGRDPFEQGSAGVTELRLVGVPSKYPLDGDTAKLDVKAGEEVVFQYDVTIPSVKGIVKAECSASYDVTAAGKVVNPLSGNEQDVIGFAVTAAEGLYLLAVEKRGEWYYTGPSDVAWVNVELSDRYGDEVLQDQIVTATFGANESANSREALLLAIPGYLITENFDPTTAPFNPEGTELLPQYAAFQITKFVQAGQSSSGDASISAESGALVEKITPTSPSGLYEPLNSRFETNELYLVTTNQKEFTINTTLEFWNVTFHSGDMQETYTDSSAWLFYDETKVMGPPNLPMNLWPEQDVREGIIVFYGENSVVLAVVYLVYDVNAEGIPGAAAPFSFQYPEYVQNATLEKATTLHGVDFWVSETGASQDNIYVLTYTSSEWSNAMVKVPQSISVFVWFESAGLTYEQQGADVYMIYNNLPVGENDALVFTAPDYMTKYVLICQNQY